MTFNQIIHHIFSSHLDYRCHVSTQCFESKQSSSEISLLQMHLLTCAEFSEIHDSNTSMMINFTYMCLQCKSITFNHSSIQSKFAKVIYQRYFGLSKFDTLVVPLVCGIQVLNEQLTNLQSLSCKLLSDITNINMQKWSCIISLAHMIYTASGYSSEQLRTRVLQFEYYYLCRVIKRQLQSPVT